MPVETIMKIVNGNLRIDKNDAGAKSQKKNFFFLYNTLPRRKGLSWIIIENNYVPVTHETNAMQPMSIPKRVTPDLCFAHHDIKDDFEGFKHHIARRAKEFQLLDNENRHRRTRMMYNQNERVIKAGQLVMKYVNQR